MIIKSVFSILLFAFGSLNVNNRVEKITVKGSDTMIILVQRWAERFMQKHDGVSIQVTGGGSNSGMAALINGTTDICNSSRQVTDTEVRHLHDRFQTTGVQITVARDGLAIYLNANNPVENLTLAQLRDIYQGRIVNWKQVGGPNARIIVYGRENNSGSYQYFKERVLNWGDFAPFVQALPGTSALAHAVAGDPNGIGYGGVAYGANIKFAKIDQTAPTRENIVTGKYPFARDLYMFLRFQPTGKIKDFVDWVLSPEGQIVVTQLGYFPVG